MLTAKAASLLFCIRSAESFRVLHSGILIVNAAKKGGKYCRAPFDKEETRYDTILVRELALFALSDEELYQKLYKTLYEEFMEAHRHHHFAWCDAFRAYYNSVIQIIMRYHEEFGEIGCRMNLQERCALAWKLTEGFLSDIYLKEENGTENRPRNEICIGKMLDSGQYTFFT